MAQIARDHANNDNLCEQVVFVLRDSGSDPGYVIDLTNNTTDIKTKRMAMTALAGFCDVSGVPALESALSDSDLSVRNSACLGLARLGKQAGDAIPALQKIPADDPLASRAQWCIRRIQATEPEPEQ
jgi:HEAT repeat protein